MGLDLPLGLNWSTTLRTSGCIAFLQRLVDRHRLGLDVELDHGIDARVLDGPLQAAAAGRHVEGLHVDRQHVLFQGQRAAQVVERIGEMAIVRRDVVAQ